MAIQTLLSGVVATGASVAMDTADADYVRVHVYRSDNAAASTATVLIQTSADGTAWYDVATVTNPTGLNATTGAGGEAWSVPPNAYTRCFVSAWTTGQITATCNAERAVT
jgi:hypothetical protein